MQRQTEIQIKNFVKYWEVTLSSGDKVKLARPDFTKKRAIAYARSFEN